MLMLFYKHGTVGKILNNNMKQENFDKLVDQRLASITKTLKIKAREYSRDGNPLHNFDKGTRQTGALQTDVLQGFLLKHLISYDDLLEDFRNELPIDPDYIKEKLGDIIVYFILQEIQMLALSEKNYAKRAKQLKTNKEIVDALQKMNTTSVAVTPKNINSTATSKLDLPFTYTNHNSPNS